MWRILLLNYGKTQDQVKVTLLTHLQILHMAEGRKNKPYVAVFQAFSLYCDCIPIFTAILYSTVFLFTHLLISLLQVHDDMFVSLLIT